MKVFSLASLFMIVAAATPAFARVNVDVNLGVPVVVQPAVPPAPVYAAPPEIAVTEAPQFIYSPSLGFYVAVGIPYDLVYTGTDYLYFHGGRWYRGPNYYGPWVLSGPRDYPPILRRYNIRQIRHYRDYEFRHYRADRAHYNGRFYRPEFHGDRRHGEHREEHREFHDRH